jgi:hypothetical protein
MDKSWTNGYALSIGGGWTPGNNYKSRADIEIGMSINHGKGVASSDEIVADGQWHHVAATYNGTEQIAYVDGVAQKDVGRWKGKVPANTFDLTIGINQVDPISAYGEVGSSFDGLIDEPMIWNRALSAKEIAFLFQTQSGGPVEKTDTH